MPSELSTYGIIVAVAAAWYAMKHKSWLYEYVFSNKPSAPSASQDWRSGYVQALLAMQSDLQARGQAQAVSLTRDLIWLLLGGDDTPKARR